MAETLVPDTSVLVDGRITQMVKEDHPGAKVLVPMAALAELEAQANQGLETGFAGLRELQNLQQSAATGEVVVEFVGERPSSDEIDRAGSGTVDSLIRDTAVQSGGLLVTSDRVQAYAAAAQGVRHHYIRPIVEEHTDLTGLMVWKYFEEDIMSVHLKADCRPMAKRGTPGSIAYEEIGTKPIGHREIRDISQECIEYAKRDYNSFVELQRHGCTVVQIGPMRITIAQPPFSDGLEVTAVRPVFKATIDDYDLPPEILDRIEQRARGVFIAGPPGSGKSTFAAAVAEHLHAQDRVVKTMEQPRDLQLPKEITQYGALDHDMKWTGEVILLVRPDHVVYDEVRTTDDFVTFADMRLAGIGLFGVSHANRPIDAVQRLIGRIDLGMIPQVVDTVVYIDAGQIKTILELSFTVKVPEGMMSEDLARPVVRVRDLYEGRDVFEIYSFGEQVVVMPLEDSAARPQTGAAALAERELKRALARHVKGPMEVEVRGNSATIYVEEWAVPPLIGKGGRTIQGLERRLGMSLNVRSFADRPGHTVGGPHAGPPGRGGPRAGRGAAGPYEPPSVPVGKAGGSPGGPLRPRIKTTSSNVFLLLGGQGAGGWFRVEAEGAVLGEAKASQQGKLRFKANSPEGKAIQKAEKAGLDIRCVPAQEPEL